MAVRFKHFVFCLLIAACVTLTVTAYIPMAYADEGGSDGEAEAMAWIANQRKATALAQHKSTTKKRKNVEDPDQYAPDSKIGQSLNQITSLLTMVSNPLSSISGMIGGLSGAMKGAMGKIGGFSSGLSALSSIVGENENNNSTPPSCPVSSIAPASTQPATGKLLASPVVGIRATPITLTVPSGSKACMEGSEVPCHEEDFDDNSKDVTSIVQKSPFTNPAPNGRGLE